MRAWVLALIHGRALELAVAVALGYAGATLADEVARVPIHVLAQHVGEDADFGDGTVLGLQNLFSVGVYLLNFKLGSTVIFYGEVLVSALALGLVVFVAVAVARMRDRELGVCPFCASRITYESTHCAYCGSGVEAAAQ